jgi:hypothetical protein
MLGIVLRKVLQALGELVEGTDAEWRPKTYLQVSVWDCRCFVVISALFWLLRQLKWRDRQ